MQVKKRNGEREIYNFEKIESAVSAAFLSEEMLIPKGFMKRLKEVFDANLDSIDSEYIDIEKIQDIIEDVLLSSRCHKVSRAFIVYREAHKELRLIKDRAEYIEKYSSSNENAATMSEVDGNANVQNKNVATLEAELYKSTNTKLSRYRVAKKLKELNSPYASSYIRDLESHIMYKHDESSAPAIKPYCVAVNMYPFLQKGTATLDKLNTDSPNNMTSFCGQFCNLVFLLSSQFQGACLYKEQQLLINNKSKTIQSLWKEESYNKNIGNFTNGDDTWEYVSTNNLSVFEEGKNVPITKVYRRPYKDTIYTIESSKGFKVQTSKDHLFKVLRKGSVETIKAADLVVFDTVFVDNEKNSIINFNSRDFKLGWLQGMICGDGCITQEPKVNLSVNYEQGYYAEIFNTYSKELFDEVLIKYAGHKCDSYEKSTKHYYSNITEGIIKGDTFSKNILEYKNKSVDYLCGFLDGILSSDGGQSHSINISLVNKNIINIIEYTLNILGVHYTYKEVEEHDNKSRLYCLIISSTVTRYTPNFCLKLKHPNKNSEIYYFSGNSRNNNRKDPNYILSTKQDHFIYANYKLDVITNISTSDNDDPYVYEIETSTHWYNCGGFITHNCAFGEFFNIFTYYCIKEYGPHFTNRTAEIVFNTNCKRKTIGDLIDQAFQNIVYTINQPAGNRSYQSPFTNVSYFDRNYWEAMFGEFVFPDGSKVFYDQVNFIQMRFMKWFNAERKKTLLTFPVETVAMLHDGIDIIDQEWKDFTAEMYAEGHSFFTYISDNADSLSSCCRLRNAIKPEFSFTSGNVGVATGSKSVITLNLNRIIQDTKREFDTLFGIEHADDFIPYLKGTLEEILERVYEYHKAYNELLKDLVNNNMMPVYTEGYISLKQQFLTIGINGLNEAAEFLGLICSDNTEYEHFCRLITSTISKQNKLHTTTELRFNSEFVPAESLGIKNYNWDKNDGYVVPEDRNCYTSYFFKPDDESISVLEQFRMQGSRFTDTLDGGVALHCNLQDHLSKAQYLKLIDYAIQEGTNYFTFNIPNSQCDDCHFITKYPIAVCPKCNSSNITQWSRIIGYLRPIKGFSKGRRIEADKRVYN